MNSEQLYFFVVCGFPLVATLFVSLVWMTKGMIDEFSDKFTPYFWSFIIGWMMGSLFATVILIDYCATK